MGQNSTILQLFGQQYSGQLLLESFESPSWITDEGWTVLHGVPVATNFFAFDGQWALQLDNSYPIINYQAPTTYTDGVAYFFDDPTQNATTLLPFAQFINGAGHALALGVDCSVNTGTYTYIDAAGVHHDSHVVRSAGWRRLQCQVAPGGGYQLLIDGAVVYTDAAFAAPNQVQLGTLAGNAGAPIFGYFDDVQLAAGQGVTVQGLVPGALAYLYDQDWNLMSASTTAAPTVIPLGGSANYPLSGRVMVTQSDGVTPAFYSAFQNFFGGDIWALAVYDFGRRPSTVDPVPTAERMDVYSSSGRRQSTFFYSLEKVRMMVPDLTHDQRNRWLGFFSQIQQGIQFGVALYSQRVFLSALCNGAAVPATFGRNQVQLIATAGINVGAHLVLISGNGTGRQVCRVTAVNAGTGVVTFAEVLLYNFSDGDTVRANYYWPQARTLDKTAGVRLSTASRSRWDVSMAFEESLP
jgi:hypothetical protein